MKILRRDQKQIRQDHLSLFSMIQWHSHCRSLARRLAMKKLFTLLMAITILAVLAAPTLAQGRSCRTYGSSNSSQRGSRVYYDNSQPYYDNSGSYYDNSGVYRNRSVWGRHRDKLTVAAGTAGGAAIGGLIGGRKGAVIGAVAGLGSSALYTYKIRNRRYRY
jgi:hypothetical protein